MNIGLIAHDNKKKLMENLCIAYRHILCKHDIYATAQPVVWWRRLPIWWCINIFPHTWAANSDGRADYQ